ncbi:5-formyltetrahydrofolate cyclo-ligase [Microbulbifer discodermiae]|uniref:5-formyltetrahydrofolate cyclo-ligase n=1 Tax=Microbulbifer sp. 2201CG32-9 TaxID=3232309 RepID=UPI00345BFA89
MTESKVQLRRHMRSARRSLSVYQQRLNGRNVINHLQRTPQLLRARHIGIYWPMDGEVDIRGLLQRQPNKYFYLPVLAPTPRPQLHFRRWRGDSPGYRNRFRIPEPLQGHSRPPQQLDLVLLPLVAFDAGGARLGMGAGFYDRTFAFKGLLRGAGPDLVGVAHQFQCVARLPTDSWDIPLQAVVTDRRLYPCR